MATRECGEYEITAEKLLKVVHRYTERIKIYVVGDLDMYKDNQREFYLTEDFSGSEEETNRVLKYYGDVPVWNIHIVIENVDFSKYTMKGRYTVASIEACCHYADIREGFMREKEDLRREKRREYNRKRKAAKKNDVD